MKGVFFNILEKFLESNYGDDAWDEALEKAEVENDVYVGPVTYEDAEFFKIFGSVLNIYKLTAENAQRVFGRYVFPQLAKRSPEIVNVYENPEDLLLHLDGVIHDIEIRKRMEDAVLPKFNVKEIGPRTVHVEYISPKKLCILVEGLYEGLADHYGCEVKYTHLTCCNKGSHSCTFQVTFKPK